MSKDCEDLRFEDIIEPQELRPGDLFFMDFDCIGQESDGKVEGQGPSSEC